MKNLNLRDVDLVSTVIRGVRWRTGVACVVILSGVLSMPAYSDPDVSSLLKYPDLCRVYETVIEGEVVAVFEPEQRLSIYRMPIPNRSKKGSLFPHRRAHLVVRYVDQCAGDFQLASGDTIAVLSQIDNTGRWKTASGEDWRTTMFDVPILDMKLGQSGVFLLKYVEDEWHVVGHEDLELYTQEGYVTENSATYRLLHPGDEEK